MDSRITANLLAAIIKANGQAEIRVAGTSMNPTLFENDLITVRPFPDYQCGDILVYTYKGNTLLVHRLLKKSDRYFCKGDNSFRLEDIDYTQILGKVILENGMPVPEWETWKTELSYLVNRAFVKCRYNIEQAKKSDIYKLYTDLILKEGESTMQYQKTKEMDFILADETSLAVFDPTSSNTYFFDETGIDILNCLESPCSIDDLLQKLCSVYATTAEDIRSDVEEFLADAVTKGIVEIV